MNFNLFLIILIVLIIIFCILYNGIRILMSIEKEKGIVKYELKVTMLKIPIFKREDSKRIINDVKDKGHNDDSESKEEDSELKDERAKNKTEDSKPKDDSEENEEEKGLREKYEDVKPILKELKKSKEELESFLNKILKAIDLKKLEGNLIIGLTDHATTIKIASWIWSIGAIVNSKKAALLTVEPKFTEVILDFEGKIELKTNLLLLLIYSLILLSKKNIRELINELYRQKKAQDKSQDKAEDVEEEKVEEVEADRIDMVEEEPTKE